MGPRHPVEPEEWISTDPPYVCNLVSLWQNPVFSWKLWLENQSRLDTRNQIALWQDHGTENPWKLRLSSNVTPCFAQISYKWCLNPNFLLVKFQFLLCEIPILWVKPPLWVPCRKLTVGCGVYHYEYRSFSERLSPWLFHIFLFLFTLPMKPH